MIQLNASLVNFLVSLLGDYDYEWSGLQTTEPLAYDGELPECALFL
ncbi:hypothetical protein WG66_007712 [Moniliophthora roreri]|nr:hypothetical protein WG66_007712 [Moniliophthora roreri]